MKTKWILPFTFLAALFTACNDDINQIGTSINDTFLSIIEDSTFSQQITVTSIPVEAIPNRTLTQLIGAIDMPGYGTLQSGFMTQLVPYQQLNFNAIYEGIVDSLVVTFTFPGNAFTGDSLAPMQLTVYELEKELPAQLLSNIDPEAEGYVDLSKPIGQTSYSASNLDTRAATTNPAYKTIEVKLSDELRDRLFEACKADPEAMMDIDYFASVFPGIYVRNTFGQGSVANISQTIMGWCYKRRVYNSSGEVIQVTDEDGTRRDSIVSTSVPTYMFTNAVPSINILKSTPADDIRQAVAAGRAIIQGPVGYDALLHFPTRNIIQTYTDALTASTTVGMLNAVTLNIPVITRNNNTTPPPYLLLMRKGGYVYNSNGELTETGRNIFFSDKLLPDGKNYFYAAYNSASHTYNFGNIREFITSIIEKDPNPGNPQANEELLLVPVTISSETLSTGALSITSVTPYIAKPSQIEIDTENIQLKLVYSTQSE
ncbi:MAG: DUF4270 family protein [Coprobacter sp.]|nr:DUF4270 family protein [Coprobacter sp.]